mgnify:CR=1 FL=1
MRTKPTRRKNYKTKEVALDNGIPYLRWEVYPEKAKILSDADEGRRVWIAGTSSSEVWKLVKYHKPDTLSFKSGGLTVRNKKGNKIDLFYEEAILHPEELK